MVATGLGYRIFKGSIRAGANTPMLKVTNAKYAVSLESSNAIKHINPDCRCSLTLDMSMQPAEQYPDELSHS